MYTNDGSCKFLKRCQGERTSCTAFDWTDVTHDKT